MNLSHPIILNNNEDTIVSEYVYIHCFSLYTITYTYMEIHDVYSAINVLPNVPASKSASLNEICRNVLVSKYASWANLITWMRA